MMVDWDIGANEQEYELEKGPQSEPVLPPDRAPILLWVVIAALVVGTAIAAYIAFGGGDRGVKVVTEPVPVDTPAPADRPLGGEAVPVVLPALDETDPIVRELVSRITSHPRLAAWLATDGLIRKFVAGVSAVAEGKSATPQLRVLRPSTAFLVTDRGGALYVDPRSFERYDALADAAASIDPAGAATIYATLKPRIEQAYRELGIEDKSFDRTLQQAIIELLNAPVGDGATRLAPQGASGYRYASPELESLTAAQKQLLRAGPANARKIQASLRAIALALGVPADRLPRSGTQAGPSSPAMSRRPDL